MKKNRHLLATIKKIFYESVKLFLRALKYQYFNVFLHIQKQLKGNDKIK